MSKPFMNVRCTCLPNVTISGTPSLGGRRLLKHFTVRVLLATCSEHFWQMQDSNVEPWNWPWSIAVSSRRSETTVAVSKSVLPSWDTSNVGSLRYSRDHIMGTRTQKIKTRQPYKLWTQHWWDGRPCLWTWFSTIDNVVDSVDDAQGFVERTHRAEVLS